MGSKRPRQSHRPGNPPNAGMTANEERPRTHERKPGTIGHRGPNENQAPHMEPVGTRSENPRGRGTHRNRDPIRTRGHVNAETAARVGQRRRSEEPGDGNRQNAVTTSMYTTSPARHRTSQTPPADRGAACATWPVTTPNGPASESRPAGPGTWLGPAPHLCYCCSC